MNIQKIIWIKLRIVMALIFLWPFLDKTFGFGFATKAGDAWVRGGSPTYGFLTYATRGPFAEFFQSLAGINLVDWVFMIGLLFVALTFLFKRFMMLGAIAGSAMLILMWLAAFPPENNPLFDDHIVYILVLFILAFHYKKEKIGYSKKKDSPKIRF